MGATTVIAVAAVVTAGAAVYSAATAPGAPNIPPPPPPANYEQYDEFGNLLTIQEWDPKRNAYVTKFDPEPQRTTGQPPDLNFGIGPRPQRGDGGGQVNELSGDYSFTRPETEAEYQQRLKTWENMVAVRRAEWEQQNADPEYEAKHKAWADRKAQREYEKKTKDEIRAQMLENIKQTPEDRVKAYEEYAKTFSEQAHRDVDEQYRKRIEADAEANEARGMTGSRYAVDLAAERGTEKAKIDTDIAQKATLAKEQLAEADRRYYNDTLNLLDSGARADTALAYQRAANAAQIANQGTAATMAQWYGQSQNELQKWQAELDKNTSMTKAYAGLAGSLGGAYLYGKQGSSPLAPSGNAAATTMTSSRATASPITMDYNKYMRNIYGYGLNF